MQNVQNCIDLNQIIGNTGQQVTRKIKIGMNYLRVYAAAKKRGKAQKDILGLLNNVSKRRAKPKQKPQFVQRPFGIFGRAISFKVMVNNATQSNNEPSQRAPNEIIVIPINRVPALKRLKDKTRQPSKTKVERKQVFNAAAKSNNQNATQTRNEHGQNKNKHYRSSKQFVETDHDPHDPEPIQNFLLDFDAPPQNSQFEDAPADANKKSDTFENIQANRTAPDFTPDNNPVDSQTPVEFTQNEASQTNGSPIEILSFDTLIDPYLEYLKQKSSSSIDFSQNVNHVEAAKNVLQPKRPFDSSPNQPDFCNSFSTNAGNLSDEYPKQSSKSGWSLNTPDFTNRSDTSSSSHELRSFESNVNGQIDETSSYNGAAADEEEPDWNGFQSQLEEVSPEQLNEPKFTMEMMMERRAMASQRILDRLFPTESGSSSSESSQSQSGSNVSTHKTFANSKLPNVESTKIRKTSNSRSIGDSVPNKWPKMHASEFEHRSRHNSELTKTTAAEQTFLPPPCTTERFFRKKPDLSKFLQGNKNGPQIVCSTNNNQLRAQRSSDFTSTPWREDKTFLEKIFT